MHVTEIGPAEVDELVNLWETAGLTRPWNDARADAHAALENPTSTVLGGIDDGALVAAAMAGYDGHRGWIWYVAVDPSRQGEGLGKTIAEEAVEWLRRRGAPKVELLVRGGNDAAVRFWRRLGFDVEDSVVMGRRF